MKRCVTGSKEWDLNFEGVAHYGLLPDFLQDLSNVGMESHDLSVLFHSAEDFARMWTKCLEASYAFVPHFTGVLQAPGTAAHLIQISFTGDGDYVVEETPNLGNASWQPANVTLVSSNGLARTIQINPGRGSKFYRLRNN